MAYTIGIDIGTTNVKSVLFAEGPRVVAEAGREYKTKDLGHSFVQQDPMDWWDKTVETIGIVIKKSGVDPKEIKVVSVSSQAPCALPVDREGKPLHDALIWMDRRSRKEVEILKNTVGADRIFELTGNHPDSYFALPEIMWFVRNKPDIMEKCYKFLQVNGFVNMKLTGNFTIDASSASLTEIMDIRKRVWSEELLSAIGADKSLMPDIYECIEPIGNITKETSILTGLSTDTVVLAGTVDATAAAMEVGSYKGGRVAEMTGTSSCVMVGYEKLLTSRNISYLEGIRKDTVVLFGAMNTAGGSLKWFRDHIYGFNTPEDDAYERFNEAVEYGTDGPGKIIYLPYLSGERAPIWDPDARGTFIGLGMETTRTDLIRAIMEGTSFALEHNLEQAYKLDIPVQQLVCCGGCSKSDIWLKIKASVIDREVVVPKISHGATGGLANVNAAYLGEFASVEEACEANLFIAKTVEPVKEWVNTYKELYEIYKDSYIALKDRFKALAGVV